MIVNNSNNFDKFIQEFIDNDFWYSLYKTYDINTYEITVWLYEVDLKCTWYKNTIHFGLFKGKKSETPLMVRILIEIEEGILKFERSVDFRGGGGFEGGLW